MLNETQKFLLSRKAKVEALIKEATEPLQAELAQIEAGLRAAAQPDLFSGEAKKIASIDSAAKTVPAQILAVLGAYPDGLLSKDITDMVNATYGRNLSRGNMSAYLSNLKKDGVVTLDDNGKWHKIDKKEPPEGGSM